MNKEKCKSCIYQGVCHFTFSGFELTEKDGECFHYFDKRNIMILNPNHSIGDTCIYRFDDDTANKSLAIVEIVGILNDEVAKIKFIKVLVDETGNGFFNYLYQTGKTMNASIKYLKNISPEKRGAEHDETE